jgi:drug/metabolite transporter (DMT)-like permease
MWFVLSLGAAVVQAGQFAVVKGRARHIAPLVIMLWTQTFSALSFGAWTWLTGASFAAPWAHAGWVLAAVALAGAMNYLLARASASGDISVVGPVLALSPIFSVAPDWLLTGALPRGLGWIGIAISVVGTVGLSRMPTRRFDVARLFARDDALCALGAAVALGLLSAVDRLMTVRIGVPGYLVAIYVCQAPITAALVLARGARPLTSTLAPRDVTALLGHAVLAVSGTACQLTALTFAPAAYVNSVRRSSAVFSVIMGRAMFGESGLGGRLTAALLMVVGALCLLLAR